MMKCPQCGAELRVTHTFTVHHGAQTRDYKCTGCGRRSSSVTFLVDDGDPATPRRQAKGAQHLAEKIRKDELILKEDDDKTQPS